MLDKDDKYNNTHYSRALSTIDNKHEGIIF